MSAIRNVACADNLDFMKAMASGSMDLIVTSPPYNIGKEYEARQAMGAYVQSQRAVIAECARLLAPGGSICWQVGNHVSGGAVMPLDIALFNLFAAEGLVLRNRIIWAFEHGLHCKRRFSGRYETILWFTRNGPYTFNLDPVRVPQKYPGKRHFKGPKVGELSCNPLGKNPGDLWAIPNVKANHPEKTAHPCQFPVELVERLVLSLTDRGASVLDPFMGSGSSLIAALKHGRSAHGCDTNPDYVDITLLRLAALDAGTLKTRPMDRPVHQPSEAA